MITDVMDASADANSISFYPIGKLFVGGIARDTDEEKFRAVFSRFGEVKDCVVMTDRRTGAKRGFGFVTFRDPSVAEKVLSEPRIELDGRPLDCKLAMPPEVLSGFSRTIKNKLFIGGLPMDATDADLRAHFCSFGAVQETMVLFDRWTGRSRGFGFVSFDSDLGVMQSLAADPSIHIIRGKRVECKRATPRDFSKPPPISMAAGSYGGLIPTPLTALPSSALASSSSSSSSASAISSVFVPAHLSGAGKLEDSPAEMMIHHSGYPGYPSPSSSSASPAGGYALLTPMQELTQQLASSLHLATTRDSSPVSSDGGSSSTSAVSSSSSSSSSLPSSRALHSASGSTASPAVSPSLQSGVSTSSAAASASSSSASSSSAPTTTSGGGYYVGAYSLIQLENGTVVPYLLPQQQHQQQHVGHHSPPFVTLTQAGLLHSPGTGVYAMTHPHQHQHQQQVIFSPSPHHPHHPQTHYVVTAHPQQHHHQQQYQQSPQQAFQQQQQQQQQHYYSTATASSSSSATSSSSSPASTLSVHSRPGYHPRAQGTRA